MVVVKALNAIFYNQDLVDIDEVVAPPYDAIDAKTRSCLYKKSAYNVVRLILNKEKDPYQNAQDNFYDWLQKKVLVKNRRKCILYLVQKYRNAQKKLIERHGFIARVKIEEFSSKNIFPHEYTMDGPKRDRLELVEKTGAFFPPVFMIYRDPTQIIEKKIASKYLTRLPFINVHDGEGVEHIVHLIESREDLKLIEQVLLSKKLLIADGHHRYETAINYSKHHPENEAAKYVMSYFTNAADKNLVIYPTHRIIEKLISRREILKKVAKYYDIEIVHDKVQFLNKIEIEKAKQITTGLVVKNDSNYYVLKLKKDVEKSLQFPPALQKLDLVILHELVLKKEFGYTQEELLAQKYIKYERRETAVFEAIRKEASACFIVSCPRLEDVMNVVKCGYRMPQKSTYFSPKILSGLVINLLQHKNL